MITVGILGGGNISETHARAAKQIKNVQIGAFYGTNQEKVERLAKLYGGRAYSDLDCFLAHQSLDVVLIGSPSGLHAEQGIMAARQGIHVLVEKPLDITVERASVLIAECQRADVKLGVFFQDRVAPGVCQVKDLLEKGQLGHPFLVSARVKWYRPPEYYSSSRWRGTLELDGGGALINQGIHTVDLLLFLLGSIKRVSARSSTALHEIEAEDTIVATLEFLNGAIGTLEATTAAYPGFDRCVELSGTNGTASIKHDQLVSLELRHQSHEIEKLNLSNFNKSAASPVVEDVGGHRKILEDFFDAIKNNRRPICDGAEGRRSVEIVEAIYQSAKTGHSVTLSSDS